MSGWGGGGFGRVKAPLDVIPIGSTQVPGDTGAADPTKDVYAEISDVVANTTTDILTFVVPATPIHHVLMIEFGGCNIAEYFIDIDGTRKARAATYFGSDLHDYWDFRNPGGGGKLLDPGSVVKIQVKHYRPDDGEFWARFCYIEIN